MGFSIVNLVEAVGSVRSLFFCTTLPLALGALEAHRSCSSYIVCMVILGKRESVLFSDVLSVQGWRKVAICSLCVCVCVCVIFNNRFLFILCASIIYIVLS